MAPTWRKAYPKAHVHEGINTWADVAAGLQGIPDGSVTILDLQGHGSYEGGIATGKDGRGPGLLERNLEGPELAAIRAALAPNAIVVNHGCDQAWGNPEAQQGLAKKLKRPVVAAGYPVEAPYNIAPGGTWYVYYPPK